jgi:hypothetical protein
MTYAEHAQAMAVLITPERMGAQTRALYDSFSSKGQEPCAIETGQVIHDFMRAVEADRLGRLPKESGATNE